MVCVEHPTHNYGICYSYTIALSGLFELYTREPGV